MTWFMTDCVSSSCRSVRYYADDVPLPFPISVGASVCGDSRTYISYLFSLRWNEDCNCVWVLTHPPSRKKENVKMIT